MILSNLNNLLSQIHSLTPKSPKGDFSPIQFQKTFAQKAPFRGLGVKCILIFFVYFLSLSIHAQVKNPILPGFYPDPSICRVDNDYYLVNSSFSYFPGVPIFHSTDLVHWKQIGHILDRPSQLKLINQGISQGIYAPAISYHEGTYYMVTTLIGGEGGNFFVTAKNPAGPWSDPIWLRNVEGIDPSFFFDENGKAYLLNNGPPPANVSLYDGHRALWMQEFDVKLQTLVGERKIIVNAGTDISKKPIWIEGPHIYKRNGFYYLMAAEGGTGEAHSEVIFRSKNIWGPYEVFSGNPILTQRDLPADRPNPITSAGHADIVETPNGDWVSVFLACQPYSDNHYNTGRQTFFHPVDWSGEWPVILENGKVIPEETTSPLKPEEGKVSFYDYSANWRDDFDDENLKLEWNFIRTPAEKWYTLEKGKLLINARPVSISEVGNPSFIGRRVQFANSHFTAALALEKEKELEAGIVMFQNEKFFYKMVVQQVADSSFLVVSSAKENIFKTTLPKYKPGNDIFLRFKALESDVFCEYSLNNKTWIPLGITLDGRMLSTKVAGGFVGAYFGLYATARLPATAKFDWATHVKIDKQ
jgi:xylan 1,4-beta-xylosidase